MKSQNRLVHQCETCHATHPVDGTAHTLLPRSPSHLGIAYQKQLRVHKYSYIAEHSIKLPSYLRPPPKPLRTPGNPCDWVRICLTFKGNGRIASFNFPKRSKESKSTSIDSGLHEFSALLGMFADPDTCRTRSLVIPLQPFANPSF